MPDLSVLTALLNEFRKLKEILIRENESNWIRGIDAIIENIEWSVNEKCDAQYYYFVSSCDTWKTMDKGNGSFSDYYIWRDDLDERVRLNMILEEIKDKIWDIVSDN